MRLKNRVKQFKILFYFMEVKSLFKRKKKYETLLCLEVLYLVLQKSKPEARIKVMPLLLENASPGLEDENKKGCDAKKSMKLAAASQSAKGARPLFSQQTCSFTCEIFSARITWRNHTSENTMKEKKKKKRRNALASLPFLIGQGSFYGMKCLELLGCVILFIGNLSGRYIYPKFNRMAFHVRKRQVGEELRDNKVRQVILDDQIDVKFKLGHQPVR